MHGNEAGYYNAGHTLCMGMRQGTITQVTHYEWE